MKNRHFLILPLVFISLLAGILTGWIRIGWNMPLAVLAGNHGALMVGSFLGTLICLERTISFPNRFALIVPLLNVLSAVFIFAGLSRTAYVFLLLGSAGLTIIYYMYYIKHKKLYILIMMAGSMCYLIGNVLLIKSSFFPASAMWWIAFLFFTITGERLDLSRFLVRSRLVTGSLIFMLALFLAGIIAPFHLYGGYIIAISMTGSAIWLFKYDMAKHSIKKPGLSFYSGIILLSGYFWLGVTGLFMAYGSYFGLLYDSALHVFFLGFVFSMIFAHAPVILPAVLKLQVNPFGKSLYFWVILLNLSLILRVSGIFTGTAPYKELAGLLNGIALTGFFLNIILLGIISKRKTVLNAPPVIPAAN